VSHLADAYDRRVGDWEYRRVEGVLYGLRHEPDADPVRPAPPSRCVNRSSPGPRGPFRETVGRLDVTIATRRLPPDELDVIERHYLRGVKQPYRVRTTAVRHLLTLLGGVDSGS
jgi:hypothetical protein